MLLRGPSSLPRIDVATGGGAARPRAASCAAAYSHCRPFPDIQQPTRLLRNADFFEISGGLARMGWCARSCSTAVPQEVFDHFVCTQKQDSSLCPLAASHDQ